MKKTIAPILNKIFLYTIITCSLGYFASDQILQAKVKDEPHMVYIDTNGKESIVAQVLGYKIDTLIDTVYQEKIVQADTVFSNELDTLHILFKDNTFTFSIRSNDTLLTAGNVKVDSNNYNLYIPFSKNRVMLVKRNFHVPHISCREDGNPN